MLLIKEEFVGGEKYRRAVKLGGYETIGLWLALKCYCSQHPDTEGFVPAEVLDDLPGAPRRTGKALQALIECGRLLPGGERGAGLLEVVERGWKMHDYLDHAPAPEEIELRREKDRLRKHTYRESRRRELDAVRRLAGELTAGEQSEEPTRDNAGHVPWDNAGHSRDSEGDSPGDSPGETEGHVPRARARPPEGAQAPAHTRAPANPNPTQPNQKTLRGLSSTIRDARASPGELGHPVDACAEHRLFAAENGLELEPFLAELRGAASTSALSLDEMSARLAAMLRAAVERRQAMGGAA